MPIETSLVREAVPADESSALQRVYAQARRAIAERIKVDADIERRLAMVVLFTVADALATSASADEDSIIQACVDRLMARTSAA